MSYTEENKRKAREVLMGKTVAGSVSPVIGTAWPCVLKVGKYNYSDVFPEHFKGGMEDFMLPDIGEIPAWAHEYIPSESDYMGDSVLIYNAVVSYALKSVTHLVGFPGTGKSEGLPVYLAHKLGLPLIRLGLNKKGMGLDDLIGRQSISNDNGTPITEFRDGMLIKWIGIPSIILADEFARANVEITNGLMSLMEHNGKLIIEDRHTPIVHRHVDCWVIASDNVKGTGDSGMGMVGTDQLDGAVLDRFTSTIEVDYLSAENSVKLLLKKIVGYPEPIAVSLCQFGYRVQEAYKQGRLPISFSVRSLYAIALKSCVTSNVHDAVRTVFLNRFDSDDKTLVAQLYKDVTGKDL